MTPKDISVADKELAELVIRLAKELAGKGDNRPKHQLHIAVVEDLHYHGQLQSPRYGDLPVDVKSYISLLGQQAKKKKREALAMAFAKPLLIKNKEGILVTEDDASLRQDRPSRRPEYRPRAWGRCLG